MNEGFPCVPIEQWSRNHWSLLMYIEICAVDDQGVIDFNKMRCNSYTHPLQYARKTHPNVVAEMIGQWQSSWGTTLKDGTHLDNHDDWDCLADLYYAGYMVMHPTNETVHLTDEGFALAHQLRKFRAQGGNYKDFTPHRPS